MIVAKFSNMMTVLLPRIVSVELPRAIFSGEGPGSSASSWISLSAVQANAGRLGDASGV
jgi:hypothetical protein